MTQADREYLSECNREYRRDIYETLPREHARGLNSNPHFGMTAWQIRHEEAVMAGPHGPYQNDEEDSE